MRYGLDSWAVLRWLEGVEPAARRVEEVLATRPLMSWINLGEVYCIVRRHGGGAMADEVLATVRSWVLVDEVSSARVLEAARIRADPMAYADAFAVATASVHDAVLLTGDPEILEAGGGWSVEDLR